MELRGYRGAVRNYSTELQFALDLARIGGEVAIEHYRTDTPRSRKDDGTW